MYNVPVFKDGETIDVKKLIFLAKKMLPDMVFNMTDLEGNPFTFPEVQTLLDGVTVGGHKLSDQNQVLRVKEGWEKVFDLTKNGNKLAITKDTFNLIHVVVAKDEALEVGVFRTGNVGISGTEYKPPNPEELSEIFNIGLSELYKEYQIESVSNISFAISVFLWASRQQFYWDGNKRTSRLVANLILISSGQGVLNVKSKDKLEFNKLMVEFYNTGDGKNIAEFLYKCIDRI